MTIFIFFDILNSNSKLQRPTLKSQYFSVNLPRMIFEIKKLFDSPNCKINHFISHEQLLWCIYILKVCDILFIHTHFYYAYIYKPVVKLLVGPRRLPAPVLHSQSHLLEVPGVSVHKGRVHGFIFIGAGLRLRNCLTHTSSCATHNMFTWR